MNECSVGKGQLFLHADGNYYTCADGLENPLFRICTIGEMSWETIDEFFRKNPAFQLLSELGPVGFLRQFAEDPAEIRGILQTPFAFGISGRGGCAIHQKLIETGLFQRVNAALTAPGESNPGSKEP